MRAVIQRVSRAQVRVEGQIIGQIGKGLLVLLGIGKGDSNKEADDLLEKMIHLRIFEDAQGKGGLKGENKTLEWMPCAPRSARHWASRCVARNRQALMSSTFVSGSRFA